MSEEHDRELPPSLVAWRGTFLEAIGGTVGRPTWRTWILAPVAVAVLLGGGAVAVAELTEDQPEPPVLQQGKTIGYRNLETGKPITCPDGSRLAYTPSANPSEDAGPQCADGSVPGVYSEQKRAYDEWLDAQPVGTALSDGPTFAYEVGNGSEDK